jgi:hypothetical protein
MDYLRARRIKEMILFALVSLTAVVANLPNDILQRYGLDAKYLLALLGISVLTALFLYLRFFFFALYALIAVGANMPDRWAEGLGISRVPLLVTLVVMVGISLANHRAKLMPTGLEAKSRKHKSAEATKALLAAIDKGNVDYARRVLELGFDPDDAGDDGLTPLLKATIAGNAQMVALLLTNGASPMQVAPDGLTAIDYALKHGHQVILERLRDATSNAAQAQP